MVKSPIFIILLWVVSFHFLVANDNYSSYRFLHITGKDGLPHQQIEALMQDNKGMLWIGTKNGLCRFDGYQIVTYFNKADNINSLNHNFIQSVFQDKEGRIWIGSYSGVCRYRPESNDFERYDFPQGPVFKFCESNDGKLICLGEKLMLFNEEQNVFKAIETNNDIILSAAFDKSNRLFVSTNNSIRYYNLNFSVSTHLNTKVFSEFLSGQTSDNLIPLFFDSKGSLWVGRNGKGVMQLNLTNQSFRIWNKDKLSDGIVRCFEEDEYGRIWIGTEKGITVIRPDGSIDVLQQNFTNRFAINDNAIYSILRDRDNNMWIGTYFGGINVLLKSTEQFTCIEPGYGLKNIKGKAVRRILEPQNNVFWIATEDGGLNILNANNGEIKTFDKIASQTHNIHELLFDKNNNEMWIGSFMAGLFRYNLKSGALKHYLQGQNNGLPSDAVFSMAQDSKSRIWIGTTRGLRFYDQKSNTFNKINYAILDNDFIYCLHIDSENNLWIGTRNNGLFKYNTHNGEIDQWQKSSNKNSLTDNYITTIYEDSEKRIWIGTNNGGLQFIRTKSKNIEFLNYAQFLSDKTICAFLEDKLKRLWISTNTGLICLNTNTHSIQQFTIDEGLPVNQFNFSSGLAAANGLFYFGTVNGLVSFSPERISTSTKPLDVHFINLNIENEAVNSQSKNSPLKQHIDDTKSITLTNAQARSFSIEYTAVLLGHTSIVEYAVRLKGVDSEWTMVGKERKIVCSNLPAGKYTLQVKASSYSGGWENAPVKELEIEILPPFYLSFWAFILYAILLSIIAYYSIRFFSIRIKERNMIKLANMEKDKMKEISQMKIDFFTSISHELKTPLSMIIGPLQYIEQDTSFSEETASRINFVLKNTKKMVSLIDELTTFNKIESGQMPLYVEKANPLEFIQSIIDFYGESIQNKLINFEYTLENNGEDVWFSMSFVEKIINNLLSNAIKFTPENGEIHLRASIIEDESNSTFLKIEVADTGIGIVPEELNNIFDNYYQTKRGLTMNSQGWGIGLALTKKLVELHKGTIHVLSTKGKGSTFSVLLNVSENTFDCEHKTNSDANDIVLRNYNFTALAVESNTTGTSKNTSRKIEENKEFKLLIVDDNEDLSKFLSDIFSKKYKVIIAKDGIEALQKTRQFFPDFIISDVMMPNMDGMEFCRAIKSDILTSHIPIILLTAKSGQQNIIKGYESGADVYIEKPFDPKALELQVSNMIKVRRQHQNEFQNNLDWSSSNVEMNTRDGLFVKHLNQLIEANLANEQFSISDITREMGVSRTVLHVKMKNLLGISIGEYIKKKRLVIARKLLTEGKNISEVSFETGFNEPNYFSKCFKKEFGITPSEFIKNKSKKIQS